MIFNPPIMRVSRQSVETEIRRVLVESFEIDAAEIRPEVNLFDDLGLDSLDAIDLLLGMETFVGKRLNDDDKDRAKQIRTFADVVEFVMVMAVREDAA